MLRKIYEQWRAAGTELPADIGDAFYAPLLVRPPDGWGFAVHKIAYVGQETREWGWTKDDASSHGLTWLSTDVEVETIGNFVEIDGSVNALLNAYHQFRFAKPYPTVHRSPFWRYFRYLEQALAVEAPTSAIFTDLIRCAANAEAGFTLWSIPAQDRERYLRWQTGLLKHELALLKPSVVLFVTGPYYDAFIEREFPESRLTALPGFDIRVLAKIENTGIAARVYRTYHPGYLNRHQKYATFDAVLEDLRSSS